MNDKNLLLFFAGWGMDGSPFRHWKIEGYDIVICSDYNDLVFDEERLKGYGHVILVAWSMGVWAASRIFEGKESLFSRRLAINGTMTPVEDLTGIPRAIFEGTLQGLNEKNLERFRRRMCASDSALLDFFNAHAPQRTLESMRTELAAIGEKSAAAGPLRFKWDVAIVGTKDLIFPVENQLRAWDGKAIVEELDIPHYAEFLPIILRQIEPWK